MVIEMYKDMKSNVPDAFNALNIRNTTTDIEGQENKMRGQKEQGLRRITTRNRLANAEILKTADGAGGKKKIEIRQSMKDEPVSITILKLIIKQEVNEKVQLEK